MPLIIDPNLVPNNDSTASTPANDANDNSNILTQYLNIDSATTTTTPRITPRFFSNHLSGNGKGRGRLTAKLNPYTNPGLTSGLSMRYNSVPTTSTDKNNSTTRYIYTSPINHSAYTRLTQYSTLTSVATCPMAIPADTTVDLYPLHNACTHDIPNHALWLSVTPFSVAINEKIVVDDDGKNHTQFTTDVGYQVAVGIIKNDDTDDYIVTDDKGITRYATTSLYTTNDLGVLGALAPEHSCLYTKLTSNVDTTIESMTRDVIDTLANMRAFDDPSIYPDDVSMDYEDIEQYYTTTYTLYDQLVAQAEVFVHDDIATLTTDIIDNCLAYGCAHNDTGKKIADPTIDNNVIQTHEWREFLNSFFHPVYTQLRYLEYFDVSLVAYNKIYDHMHATLPEPIIDALVRANMQLSLNANLQKLNSIKDVLPTPQIPQNYTIDPKYSHQQRTAITTDEPLTIVQAGAGTGKSTVILERINYLCATGVNPQDILVLSFTNAAADNIKLQNPNINSMTIAKMIHETYEKNHPTHQLSDLQILLNSLDIHYRDQMLTHEFMRQFRTKLDAVRKGGGLPAVTDLGAFVEKNIDDVLTILDQVQQTTLDLEIIISYIQLYAMADAHGSPQYIIIDEVQDNSIFEFVYSLRYAHKHTSALYIVGDSSQTLYEFRDSDPKALNALEASGIFAAYRLSTNYRSNQEILDFANITLSDIEANRYAKIQLNANSRVLPTVKSFKNAVDVVDHPVKTKTDFNDQLIDLFAKHSGVKEWIQQNMDAGEQTAVLAFKRKAIQSVSDALEYMFPNTPPLSLVSERSYPFTVFSDYIKNFFDEVEAVAPAFAASTFSTQVQRHLRDLVSQPTKAAGTVNKALSEWWLSNQAVVDAWVVETQQGRMTPETFFYNLRENITAFEIELTRKRLMGNKAANEERKANNDVNTAPLIVSTIHGVKGLEFDNVIVIQEPDDDPAEDVKRLFYVAYTRAKHREKIITGFTPGSGGMSPVKRSYDSIVDALTERDKNTIVTQPQDNQVVPRTENNDTTDNE